MTERPPSKNPWLRMSPLPRAIGVVCIVVGGVWLMQGVGFAKGSVMTGSTVWAVLGALTLAAGAIVLQRASRTAKQAIANDPPADGSAPPPAEPPVI
jgi:hypothetical protein